MVLLVLATGAGLGSCSRGSTGGGSTATAADYCRAVKQENARLTDLAGGKAIADRAATAVKKLSRAAPAEIHDDVELLADGYTKAANGDFASLASRVTKFEAALKHVTKYTTDNCNFDLRAR
ncbi:MAG: hypothetical protein QOI44_1247 [Actinomycetota bacterium]|nr:hypothetical protein [Actinomycetota bacterium]